MPRQCLGSEDMACVFSQASAGAAAQPSPKQNLCAFCDLGRLGHLASRNHPSIRKALRKFAAAGERRVVDAALMRLAEVTPRWQEIFDAATGELEGEAAMELVTPAAEPEAAEELFLDNPEAATDWIADTQLDNEGREFAEAGVVAERKAHFAEEPLEIKDTPAKKVTRKRKAPAQSYTLADAWSEVKEKADAKKAGAAAAERSAVANWPLPEVEAFQEKLADFAQAAAEERATQRQLARLLAKMPEHARLAFNLQRSTLPSDLGNYIEEAELAVAKALSFWLSAQEETGNENKKSDDKKSEKDKKQKKEKRRNQQDKRATTETKKMEKLKKKASASTSTSSSEPPPARSKGAEKRALDDWQLSEVQSFAAEWAVFAQAAAQKRAAETEFLQLLGKVPVKILDFYDLRRAALPARILSFVEDVGEVVDKALAHWTWKAAE